MSDPTKKPKKECKKKTQVKQKQQQQQQPKTNDIFAIAEDVGEDQNSEMKPSVYSTHNDQEKAENVVEKFEELVEEEEKGDSDIQSNKSVRPKKVSIEDKTEKKTPITITTKQPEVIKKSENVAIKANEKKPLIPSNSQIKPPVDDKASQKNIKASLKPTNIKVEIPTVKNTETIKKDDEDQETTALLDELQGKLTEAEHKNEDLNNELLKSKNENAQLKKQVDLITKEKEQLQGVQDTASFQKQIKILKEAETKLKKELTELKAKITAMSTTLNKAKADATQFERLYLGSADRIRAVENNLLAKDGQVKSLGDKNTMMMERNKDLEMQNIDVNKRADQMYKDKKEMETVRDQMHLQIVDLQSQCEIIKRENKNLTEILVERNKATNERIADFLQKIQEQSKEIAQLRQEKLAAEHLAAAERNAKEELKIQLRMLNAQVAENEELRKKVEKKDEKIEELEDYADKLKTKLRKWDTQLTVKDQYGQIKDYRNEKYSELLDQKQQQEMDRLKRELQTLTESIDGFRVNGYKNESEKESLRVENISLREEIKRLERLRNGEHGDYESEILEKHRSLEQVRVRMQTLQDQNEELEKAKVTKIEILRDNEFKRMEEQYNAANNKIMLLESQVNKLESTIDHLNSMLTKKQMILGDMYFQNENLKEEVEYLSQIRKTSSRAKTAMSIPLKNIENLQYINNLQDNNSNIHQNSQNQLYSSNSTQQFPSQQQQPYPLQQDRPELQDRMQLTPSQQQQQQGNQFSQGIQYSQSQPSLYRQADQPLGAVKQHVYERLGYDPNLPSQLTSPGHFERDNYANFYRDTREMIESANRYQSGSTLASQSRWSAY